MQYLTLQPIRYLGALVVFMLLFLSSPVNAQETVRTTTLETFDELTDHTEQVRTIWVPLYKSHILKLNRKVKKISIGNPDIADILIMRADQLYVLGRGLGTTNVLLWDNKDRLISAFDIEVAHDLDTLKAKLFKLLPNEDIKVHSSQGAIILSGEVSSLTKMNTAIELANSFMPATKDGSDSISSVVNLMGVGGAQQVLLKVTVAEVSRGVTRNLGIEFNAINNANQLKIGAVNGGAAFNDLDETFIGNADALLGPPRSEFNPTNHLIEDTGLFASYLNGDFLFNMALNAAKGNDTAKVLAEPTLTTLSGQEAKFLSGGEFPIPVPDEDGITIEYKEFGIGLAFVPVVMDSNKINLKLSITVSDIGERALNFGVPGTGGVPFLSTRSASSTVELADGQTIGIAGLINETMTESIKKFPGLGDIPILGNLFRSQSFSKGETELVILVTPHLAKPVDRANISLPTDDFVEPSDFEFYILGKTLGSVTKETSMENNTAEEEIAAEEAETTASQTNPEQPATSYAVPPLPTVGGKSGGMENSYGHSMN